MHRIDKFLEYYNSLNDCQVQIDKGVWVNSQPLPFHHGIFSKEYWKQRKQRKKDAKSVLNGKAIAVSWESE